MPREEELEAEVLRLQTELVNATTEIEQLSLDKQAQAQTLEEEKRKLVAEAEYDAYVKIQAEKEAANAAVLAARREVVELKSAFEGDMCGWVEVRDEQNRPVYQNSNTGEATFEKPVVMRIAETMAAMEESKSAANEVIKHKKAAEEAKSQARAMQTKVNELKEQINNITQLNREWVKSGGEVHQAMMAFRANLNEKLNVLSNKANYLQAKSTLAEKQNKKIQQVIPAYAVLKQTIIRQRDEITRLNDKMKQVSSEHEELKTKHRFLTDHFQEEIDRNVKPVQEEMTRLYAALQKSFLEREEDRKDVACLWPPEHLMPSILLKYKPIDKEQRLERKRQVEMADAEIALRAEIQRMYYESTRWSIQYDNYGRPYYLHADTGETSWDEPEAVRYRPPVGRDRQGNKVDLNDAARVWATKQDVWGNMYYENLLTNETFTEKPAAVQALEELQRVQEEEKAKAKLVDAETEAMKASRVVIRFIKGKLEEQKRKATESSQLYDGTKEAAITQLDDPAKAEAEDDDAHKWVYDMIMVEELAKGSDRWTYENEQAEEEAKAQKAKEKDAIAAATSTASKSQETTTDNVEQVEPVIPRTAEEKEAVDTKGKRDLFSGTDLTALRELLHKAVKREEQLQQMLKEVRRHMADLSYVMLDRVAIKEAEEKARLAALKEAASASSQAQASHEDEAASTASSHNGYEQHQQQPQEAPIEMEPPLHGDDEAEQVAPEPLREETSHLSSTKGSERGSHSSTTRSNSLASSKRVSQASSSSSRKGSSASKRSSKASMTTTDDVGSESGSTISRSPQSVGSRKSHQTTESATFASDVATTGASSFNDAPMPVPPVIPYGRASNRVVHALAVEAFYSGFFHADMRPVDLAQLRAAYSESRQEDEAGDDREAVKMGEDWLASQFFYSAHTPDRYARQMGGGVSGGGDPMRSPVNQDLISMDDRFLCLPLAYHEVPQVEAPPIAPPAPDPVEVERARKRRHAEKLKEARKKGIKVEDIPDDPPAPLPPPTYTGQPVPLEPSVPVYTQLGDKPPLALALGAHERLRREAARVLERQMVLFDQLARRKPIEEGQEEDEENRSEDLPDEKLVQAEGSDGQGEASWGAACTDSEQPVKPTRTHQTNKPRVAWRVTKVEQKDTSQINMDAEAALQVKRVEEEERRRNVEDLLLDSLEGADPVIGGRERERRQKEASEKEWVATERPASETISKPKLLVSNIAQLRVRCPELEIRHERSMHDATLKPLLQESEAIRSKVRQQHQEMLDWLSFWVNEVKGHIASASASFKTVNFEANDKLNQVKMLSIPSPEPKCPPVATVDLGAGCFITVDEALADRYKPSGKSVKYSEDDIDSFIQMIAAGSFDGAQFVPPGEKTMTSIQAAKLIKAIDARNKVLKAANDTKVAIRDAEMKVYEEKMAEWRRVENSRLDRLMDAQCKARVSYIKLDAQTAIKAELESRLQDLQAEQESEARRFEYICENENRLNVLRGKYVADQLRSEDAVRKLQDELCKLLKLHERALKLPECALSEFERPAYVQEARRIITALQYPMVKLREALVEEGRRLRYLMAEEVQVAKMELQRQREDKASEDDRLQQLVHLNDQVKKYLQAANYAMDSRVALATQRLAVPGLETEYKERYPEDWRWDEEGDQQVTFAGYKQDLVLGILHDKMRHRADRRRRDEEARVRHMALCEMQLPPPHEQWLTKARETRYETLLEMMRCSMNVEAIVAHEELIIEKRRKIGVDRQVLALQKQVKAMVASHEQEAVALREVALSTFSIMKEQTARIMAESRRAIEAINKDLKEVTAEYNELREQYEKEVGEYKSRVTVLEEWVQTLRLALNTKTEQLEKVSEDAETNADRLRNEALSVKTELRVEREHTYRLELWIGALIADMRKYDKLLADKDQAYETLKQQKKKEDDEHKYQVWRKSVALQKLATDPHALFLFFIQRVAAMAGSRKAYNDALRENGANIVILALCQSAREDIKRFAARAMGSIMWNGYVEQRILTWDVQRCWKVFEEEAVVEEEQRLREVSAGLKVKGPYDDDGQTGYDPDKQGFEDEFRPSPSLPMREIIRARRQWSLRLARRKESPNLDNQRLMGCSDDQLRLMLKLCRDPVKEVVRNAALALSLAAYCEDNVDRMGRLAGCIDTLLYLVVEEPEPSVHPQALVALANLAYSHPQNQEAIAAAGAVEILLNLCRSADKDTDVVECATAALANLTSMFEPNCVTIGRAGGVEVLTGLLTSNQTANLLDFDQMEEIQANAAEALANITKLSENKHLAAVIHSMGIQPFVIMCGSKNLLVMRHAPLVVGNIAQEDRQREALGEAGAIEALFVLLEREDDQIIQANGLWALGNLAWNRNNADRIGRYLGELLRHCRSNWLPIQTNAMVCLSNALYYNEDNRQLLEDMPDGVSLIVNLCDPSIPDSVAEPAMRALVSLCYPDRIAIPLTIKHETFIPMLVKQVNSTSVEIQRQAIKCLTNLAVHDANKVRLVEASAVEALVSVQGSDDEAIRLAAAQLLELMADIKSPEDMVDRRFDIGMDGLIHLCAVENEPVQKLAIETLVDMAQSRPERQEELAAKVHEGGLDLFLRLVRTSMDKSIHNPLLEPSLWGVRNLTHNNRVVMTKLGRKGGMDLLLEIIRRCKGVQSLASTLEAALAALLVTILGHEANCRRVMMIGLDMICGVAENHVVAKEMAAAQYHHSSVSSSKGVVLTGQQEAQVDVDPAKSDLKEFSPHQDDLPAHTPLKGATRAVEKNCVALATSILQLIGPYNFIVCGKCGSKEKGGTQCSRCGKKLKVEDGPLDLGDKATASFLRPIDEEQDGGAAAAGRPTAPAVR